MRPSSRSFLSFLAIIGSLDIGFSFAHASQSPTSQVHGSNIIVGTGMSSLARVATPATTMPLTAAKKSAQSRKRLSNTSTIKMTSVNGGAAATAPSYKKASVFLTSLWGSGGVIYILAKAIKRVVPIAMEPFAEGAIPLSQVQLGYVILMLCS